MSDTSPSSGPESTPTPAPRKWLVAAWPGMGNVASIAAGYLIARLQYRPAGDVPPHGHFDIQAVEVKEGLIETPRMPVSLLYRPGKAAAKSDKGEPPLATGNKPPIDLTILIGEAQPTAGEYAYASELMDRAARLGVNRVVTFASMATQMHPLQQPTVFGAATSPALLDELRRLEVRPLKEGQIGGLNGLILGVCAERGIDGLCLMGEIPFFAAGVPNPKASRAVLDTFGLMTGLKIDLEELSQHAETIDSVLVDMLEKMKRQEREDEEGEEHGEIVREIEPEPGPSAAPKKGEEPAPDKAPALEPEVAEKIERLFEQAKKNRAKAVDLKRELDRLGAFGRYENRFLDLFKRAE